MKFWKLHGIGNDFIAIDGRFDQINPSDYTALAKKVCHRRFSVGADGLLVVKDSKVADVEMVYYNSDGSRAAMCGNGLRCFCKFVYDNCIVKKESFTVDTLDGIKDIKVNLTNREINSIRVNMGKGSFIAKDVPVLTNKERFVQESIKVLDRELKVTSMLMGVPHTVVIVDELDVDDVCKYGKEIENNKIFPEKTNVNFVKVEDKYNIHVYTWERGCGYTLGCGTGMTASAIVCNLLNMVESSVNVTSQGGTVKIDVGDFSYMTGPAVKICEGVLEV
ncbi:diaminopimelate epimerase [Clostridioides difficile]|uniref:diaminopimelate epimerase n=1 Tax=Clostridioides difficile TaxID=1496 RepID=UPI0003B2954D|nr:diaminopimelate epimerase [Clostridioides difficile]MDB2753161.1 diaminopimelate epimerase [Clostridioides difficile]MDY6688399.1 diaminopimelate epimerase [Clostridioides difficile]CCL11693.1 Diaminopimelate epimerase (DAP epimerase) [Clostridioides difficile E16]CCL96212.1 Diaminopimelate epimerase (DAP epimerase) [Clostridioides difficile T61]SJN68084.1 Diaminopimelate epimerase [Clostridioides difficile]